ncbi:MAG: endonuclease III domain-containing protein [Nitrososphaeria archaeon]
MRYQQGNEIINRLRKRITINKDSYTALQFSNPFEILVSTILSQNTNDRNSSKATRKFVERTKADPFLVIKTDQKELSETIKCSGMHNQKAQTIIRAARWVVERYNGDLAQSRKDDPQQVKNELLKIKGIGPKTADVFLLFYLGARVFPVDVHIKRVSLRLNLARGDYGAVSGKLLDIFKDPLEAHLMLIALGRKYCRPTAPKCNICPLRDICPSANKF